MSDAAASPRAKTAATWLALLGGSLGAHRFYLYGWRDKLAWLHPPPALLGLAGVVRMANLGQDDQASWLLIPLLGLMLSIGMMAAILYGLTPDAQWALRHRQGAGVQATGWAPVLGVVLALLVGGAVLMGTLAFGGQMFFEYQAQRDAAR